MKLKGAGALIRALEDRQSLSRVKKIVKVNGSEMQRNMMRNASFVKGYQTGTTKRSIKLAISDGGFTANVEPTTHYSPYLEFGTRYMSPQPFIRPAFYNSIWQFQEDLEKLVR